MPELTEEDLKNMSPEELIELQKKNCLFCQLASGVLPTKKIYEDEICFAILDINPAVKGHILLIPKEHYVILPQTPDKVVRQLAVVSKLLSKTLIKALGAQGTNIFIANGAVAGQRAPHLIVHIIPRNENDNLTVFDLPQRDIREEDLLGMQKALAGKLGTKIETQKTEPVKDNKDLEEIDYTQLKRILE
jgi:histidine triad (HIT) family protein